MLQSMGSQRAEHNLAITITTIEVTIGILILQKKRLRTEVVTYL